jgi:hypothetical protein
MQTKWSVEHWIHEEITYRQGLEHCLLTHIQPHSSQDNNSSSAITHAWDSKLPRRKERERMALMMGYLSSDTKVATTTSAPVAKCESDKE